MGCGTGLVKFLVFVANFIFAIAGIALIVVGVLYKLHVNKVTDAIPPDYTGISLAPTLTIVAGALIFVISFFGCCGAIRESSCLLTTYAVILLAIFILQIALGVYVFLEVKDKKTFESKVDQQLAKIFNLYDNNKNSNREVVDVLQGQLLDCCGLTGPGYWKSHSKEIPSSCYPNEDTSKAPYSSGCQTAFKEFLDQYVNVIGIVVLSFSATEVIGSIFALCLANSIRNNLRRGNY